MVKNKWLLISYKLFFSLLGFSAIVTEIATIVERGVFSPVNFFSFFTIETNILVFITLLVSAIALAAGKVTRILDIFRGAVTVYILMVGIGFALLLSGLENAVLTAVPWDNIVLHYIIPVAVLVDFIIDRPKHKLVFTKNLPWLLFPIVYVAYSLIRGLIVGWYPYPFLDPETNGYGGIAVTIFGLLVLELGLIWVVSRLSSKGS